MKSEAKLNDIQSRLVKVVREYSPSRRIGSTTQMCELWQDPTIEVFEGSDELNAPETEFDLDLDEDEALELYDMSVQEAAEYIASKIIEQKSASHTSDSFIDELGLDEAKNILKAIWNEGSSGKILIMRIMDTIEHNNKMKKLLHHD